MGFPSPSIMPSQASSAASFPFIKFFEKVKPKNTLVPWEQETCKELYYHFKLLNFLKIELNNYQSSRDMSLYATEFASLNSSNMKFRIAKKNGKYWKLPTTAPKAPSLHHYASVFAFFCLTKLKRSDAGLIVTQTWQTTYGPTKMAIYVAH